MDQNQIQFHHLSSVVQSHGSIRQLRESQGQPKRVLHEVFISVGDVQGPSKFTVHDTKSPNPYLTLATDRQFKDLEIFFTNLRLFTVWQNDPTFHIFTLARNYVNLMNAELQGEKAEVCYERAMVQVHK